MAATVEEIIERRELAIRDEYNSGLTNMVGMCDRLDVRWHGEGEKIMAGAVSSVDFRKLHFSVHLSCYRSKSKSPKKPKKPFFDAEPTS